MSYIENNLLPGEKIDYEGKVHWFYSFIGVIGVVFGLILLVAGAKAGGPMWMIGFGVVCGFGYNLLFIATTEIAVTSKRVIYKTGIIARNVFELQLAKVESARLDQSIFQRIIGAGTLIVSGTGGHNKPIQYLEKPTAMRTIIYKEIEENS